MLTVSQPNLQLVGVENVDDAFAGDLGSHCDSRGIGVELEVGHGVGVRGENDVAACSDGKPCEVDIKILAAGEAIDLDCDPAV